MGTRQSLEVTPLEASRAAQAGATLGRALVSDPLWTAIVRDPERRSYMMGSVFTGVTKATIAARGVAEEVADMTGVALWLPPGREMGLLAMVRSGLAMPRFVMSLPRQDRKRMMASLRQVGERRTALMPDPHWYVVAIGVDPEFQGRGLGSVLMRHGIARADGDSKPIYLETETEGNVAFYRRLGFDVIEEFTLEGLDIVMWLMVRRTVTSDS